MSDLEHEKYTIADVKNGRTPSDYVLAIFRKAYQAGYKQDDDKDQHLILTLAWNHIAAELRHLDVPMPQVKVTDQMSFITAMEASNVSWEGIFRKYNPQGNYQNYNQQGIAQNRFQDPISTSAGQRGGFDRGRGRRGGFFTNSSRANNNTSQQHFNPNNPYYASGRAAHAAQPQQLTITQGPARVPVNFGEVGPEVSAESEWQNMMGFGSGGTDFQACEQRDSTTYDRSTDMTLADYFQEDTAAPLEVANFSVSNPSRSSAPQPQPQQQSAPHSEACEIREVLHVRWALPVQEPAFPAPRRRPPEGRRGWSAREPHSP